MTKKIDNNFFTPKNNFAIKKGPKKIVKSPFAHSRVNQQINAEFLNNYFGDLSLLNHDNNLKLKSIKWNDEASSTSYDAIIKDFDEGIHADALYFSNLATDFQAKKSFSIDQKHEKAAFESEMFNFLKPEINESSFKNSINIYEELIKDSTKNFLSNDSQASDKSVFNFDFSFSPKKCETIVHYVLEESFGGLHSVVNAGGSLSEYVLPITLTRPLMAITHGCLDLSHLTMKYASSTGIYGGHFFVTQALPWMTKSVTGLAQKGGLNSQFIEKIYERSDRAFTASPVLQKFSQKGGDYAQYATNLKNFSMNLLGDITGKTAQILNSLKEKHNKK